MADIINLESGRAIRKWRDNRASQIPTNKYSRPMNTEEYLNLKSFSRQHDSNTERKSLYRIEHSIYLPADQEIVYIECVILAVDSEDALEKYIFDSNSRCIENENGEYLATIVKDDYRYEFQRIFVDKN